MRALRSSLVVTGLACLGAAAVEPLELPRPTEYEVKAAFLYNFAKFVKWPAEQSFGPTFVVAVLGVDPFGEILDRTFADKTLVDRKVEIRRIDSPSAASDVQVLFVGSSEKARLPQVLKTLEGRSVLTVGELDGFSERGGMIGLKVRDDVVRFDINLVKVESARLKMSSQIIRLAQRVISKADGS